MSEELMVDKKYMTEQYNYEYTEVDGWEMVGRILAAIKLKPGVIMIICNNDKTDWCVTDNWWILDGDNGKKYIDVKDIKFGDTIYFEDSDGDINDAEINIGKYDNSAFSGEVCICDGGWGMAFKSLAAAKSYFRFDELEEGCSYDHIGDEYTAYSEAYELREAAKKEKDEKDTVENLKDTDEFKEFKDSYDNMISKFEYLNKLYPHLKLSGKLMIKNGVEEIKIL